MATMKILISGAGIAGNALAFWLSKLGHDVTVIKRFPSIRATGLQLDLRGHGIEVMKRMGLEQEFRSKSAPEQGVQVVDKSGRRWGYFPANKSGKGEQNFTSEYETMRGDLCRLLYNAAKDRAKFIFGSSIESFEDRGSFVDARFADGGVGSFDLVVGADGQWSRTRGMMLGSDMSDAFHPLYDDYITYFTITRPIQEGEGYICTMYMAPGNRGVMTRMQNPDELQVYLACTTNLEQLKNARRGDTEEEKAALAEIFRDAGWKTDDILRSLDNTTDFYCERLGLVKMESWSRGRVVLVGDAAYCPSANTGMGTTSSIVGAYILAGEIGTHCGRSNTAHKNGRKETNDGLTVALKSYDRKFRPFMDQVQEGVEDEALWERISSSAFGITILKCIFGIASLFRVNIGKYILKESVKGCDLPEYQNLLGG